MKLTREAILDNRTDRGSWTRGQLESLGVSWPPQYGWLDRLDGTEISDAQWQRFIEMRNVRAGKLKVIKKQEKMKEIYGDLFG